MALDRLKQLLLVGVNPLVRLVERSAISGSIRAHGAPEANRHSAVGRRMAAGGDEGGGFAVSPAAGVSGHGNRGL
jgi:hypothetical protein